MIPVVALFGVLLAIFVVWRASQPVVPAQPVVQPARVPYDDYIAGAGIVESSSENIAIGTHLPGIVTEVFVEDGDEVEAGDPLFKIDDRELRAQLRFDIAQEAVAEAMVLEAQSMLAQRLDQLRLAEKLTDARAISVEEMDRRRHAVTLAQSQVATANAQLDQTKAKEELTRTDIERLTVRAPIAGEILQVNIHPGEYVQAGQREEEAFILMGQSGELNVLADIDEHDAWRFRPSGEAAAFVRGQPAIQLPLKFLRVTPYVAPKRSLTGEMTERVDTRVLQVLYRIDLENPPVYVGQQVDVYIQVTPTPNGSDSAFPHALFDPAASDGLHGGASLRWSEGSCATRVASKRSSRHSHSYESHLGRMVGNL